MRHQKLTEMAVQQLKECVGVLESIEPVDEAKMVEDEPESLEGAELDAWKVARDENYATYQRNVERRKDAHRLLASARCLLGSKQGWD